MLKFINSQKLFGQISNQSLTYVNAFLRATVGMSNFIMPSLRRKPEERILHVGTNNLKFSEPREIAEGIVNLGLTIQNHSPDCKITISSLIWRSDQTLNNKIEEANKIVNQFAKQRTWRTIPHSNIKNKHLNASGLHVNVQGTKLLAKNLISHLRNSWPSNNPKPVLPSSILSSTNEFIPNNRGFKMACLNITSLSKHIDELRVLLQNNSLDLSAISEMRLNETVADNEISISGYDIIRRDRSLNGRNRGGVCFYLHSNINYIVREDLVSDQIENLSIEIVKK